MVNTGGLDIQHDFVPSIALVNHGATLSNLAKKFPRHFSSDWCESVTVIFFKSNFVHMQDTGPYKFIMPLLMNNELPKRDWKQ